MFVLFFLLWIVFNGQITLEIVLFGLVISAALYWFICRFMEYSFQRELAYLKKGGYLIQYLYYLLKEIVKGKFCDNKTNLFCRQSGGASSYCV